MALPSYKEGQRPCRMQMDRQPERTLGHLRHRVRCACGQKEVVARLSAPQLRPPRQASAALPSGGSETHLSNQPAPFDMPKDGLGREDGPSSHEMRGVSHEGVVSVQDSWTLSRDHAWPISLPGDLLELGIANNVLDELLNRRRERLGHFLASPVRNKAAREPKRGFRREAFVSRI